MDILSYHRTSSGYQSVVIETAFEFKCKQPSRSVHICINGRLFECTGGKGVNDLGVNSENDLPDSGVIFRIEIHGGVGEYRATDKRIRLSSDSFMFFIYPERMVAYYMLHKQILPPDLIQLLRTYM